MILGLTSSIFQVSSFQALFQSVRTGSVPSTVDYVPLLANLALMPGGRKCVPRPDQSGFRITREALHGLKRRDCLYRFW